jgi:hypothetical protein
MRKGLEYLYLGTWRVVRDTDNRQMLGEFINHRQKKKAQRRKETKEQRRKAKKHLSCSNT